MSTIPQESWQERHLSGEKEVIEIDKHGDAVCDACNDLLAENYVAVQDFIVNEYGAYCLRCAERYKHEAMKTYRKDETVEDEWLKKPLTMVFF